MFKPAARSLIRTPATTLACVLTLACGIAAASAMFSLIYPLLIRPLVYPGASALFALQSRTKISGAGGVSWQDVLDLRAKSQNILAAAAYAGRTWGFRDSFPRPVEVVLSGMVTPEFFTTLGVEPQPAAPLPSAGERIAWLSHSFWARRYEADPRVAGSAVYLNDESYRIAGILPTSFRFPINGENPDVYILLNFREYCCQRDARGLGAIARLRPGASRSAAQDELDALSAHLASAGAESNRRVSFHLAGLQAVLAGDRRRPLLLLGLASALLLLVAAANSAGILLARAARRYREMLTKASLGAGWVHLLREHLAEGILIAALSSVTGTFLTLFILHLSGRISRVASALENYGQIADIRPGLAVFSFSIAVSVLTAIVATLVPLFFFRPGALNRGLRAVSTASAPLGAVHARHGLVAGQVMLTTTLLAAGGMIFQHLHDVLTESKGFRTDQVVMAGIGIPEARYDTDEKMIRFHERVLANLRTIPGVETAAGGIGLPLSQHRSRFLLGDQNVPPLQRPSADIGVASPGLFSVLDIPLVQGRFFDLTDDTRHPLAAIVNRAFLARYPTGHDAAGTRLRVGFRNGGMKPWSEFEIIGVVADARNRSLEMAPEPAIYLCSLQVPMEGFLYFVRTGLPAAALTSGFRSAVWSVDKDLERVTPRPLEPYVEAGLEGQRLAVWLIGLFGAAALLLAAAGLGAAISAGVSASKKEIAIRVALGETPLRMLLRVLRQAGRMAAFGVLPGIAGAIVLSKTVLWGRETRLLPACCAACFVLLVTLVAAAIPARRAALMDAMESLRGD